jgi:hypothetical protein
MRTLLALSLVSALVAALPADAQTVTGTNGSTATARTTGNATASTSTRSTSPAPSLTGPQANGVATRITPLQGTQPSGTSGSNTTSTATTDATTIDSIGSSALLPSNQTSGSIDGGQTTSGTGQGRTIAVLPAETNVAPPAETPAAASSGGGVIAADLIGANGERLVVNTVAATLPAPAIATPTPTLDAATAVAERRLRAKTARKQQLMHSIVPRTNVDRTDQMPDDPISPSLR